MRLESGNNSNNNNVYVSKLKNGHNGVNSQNGQNGVNSQNGQNGVNSQNGQNGINSQNGQNEMNGQHGVNGQHETNGKSKINGYNGVNRKNGVVYSNGKNEHNGQNGDTKMGGCERNVSWPDSEEDSDIEAEPVSGSLVLKIVSEPPTTRKTPSKTSVADEDFGYASLEPTETYLQVQVQRSTSSSALCKPNCRDDLPQRSKSSSSLGGPRSRHCSDGSNSLGGPRSRHCSTGSQFGPSNGSNGSAYPIYNGSRYGSRSRQTSGATTRSGSISPTMSDSSRASSVNVTDLMAALNRQASQMHHGMKELRDKVDNPYREKTPAVEDERIVLSGLNKQASISLRNIKNLYDETKYLKSYLEKLEANVHYDLTIKHKKPSRPAWWRRLAFLGFIGFAIAFIIYRRNPEKMTARASLVGSKARDVILTFFTSSGRPVRTSVCLMGPGDV